MISAYSILSHNSNNAQMRTWDLKASNNGVNWRVIDSVLENDCLANSNIGVFHLNIKKGYRMFKLEMTRPTNLDNTMRIKNVDLFGTVVGIYPHTCYTKRSKSTIIISFILLCC